MRLRRLFPERCLRATVCASAAFAAVLTTPADEPERQFKERIAPLLVQRCIECHGPDAKKGRLDLSKKDAAFAGGDGGKAIVPGDADASLLWQYVESNEMPKGRKPLTDDEKKTLREWIEAGAGWTVDTIVGSEKAVAEDWIQRLTVSEYVETVRSSLGVDVDEEARQLLPRDLRADGFSNTAYNLSVDLSHVQAYAKLAEGVVSRIDVLEFAAKHADPAKVDAARKRWDARKKGSDSPLTDEDRERLRPVVEEVGKRLLRGPLEEREFAAYLDVADAVAREGGDFEEALGYVLEAMLQSPRFIYRVERRDADSDSRRAAYELASRLSYILWGAPPDEELYSAAEDGKLVTAEDIERQVERMLKDPRAIERSQLFLAEWMNLDRLDSLRPDPKRYPTWSPELAADMREETLAFFRHVAWEEKRPLSDLLNAQVTFATPRLVAHYGLSKSSEDGPSTDRQAIEGILALYRFDEAGGDVIRDVSGAGEPIDLKIDDPGAVERSSAGLTLKGPTEIVGEASKRLVEAAKKSKAWSLEAWIAPANVEQAGPARIVTLSSGTNKRNFTLGQDGEKFDLRIRSRKQGDDNGMPSLATQGGSASTDLVHVCASRDASGVTRIYLNGEEVTKREGGGDFSNWDSGYRLLLGNESSGDRPWLGTYRLVAIYGRALSRDEVRQLSRSTPQRQEQERIDLEGEPARGGLLTQGSVLTIGGDDSSMVARGLFVLHDLLDSGVADPPPCVDTTPVASKAGLSQRAIAQQRLENGACRGCHARFEPFAFGLERFDGTGIYREKDEHGNALRHDGEILFPGSDKAIPYESSAELMDLLAGSDRVKETIVRKLTQFALGRPLTPADDDSIEKIHRAAIDDGGTYAATISAIVTSDLVRSTGDGPP